MDKRVPQPVRLLLEEYLDRLEVCLPEAVLGVYLHGSIALESFDSKSDVDFLTLVKQDLKCEQLALLTDLHGELIEKFPSLVMQGSYVKWQQENDLDDYWDRRLKTGLRLSNCMETPYFDGFMMTNSTDGLNNPITWWLIKECGICLKGLPPSALTLSVNENTLTSYVLQNMNEYWRRRVERFWQAKLYAETIPQNEFDFEVEWIVLGLLRQLFTLKEHRVISKLAAAEYGLKTLPGPFHLIIEEAVQIRKGLDSTFYSSNHSKLEETYKLSRFIFDWAASCQHDVYS